MEVSLADNFSRVRLIGLGDELLAGVGDPRALGWLGRCVASQDAAIPVELFACALPRDNSASLSHRYESEVELRLDRDGLADGTVAHRVVIGMGNEDISAGISLARSRLNLSRVLDGLDKMRIPAFVVGPPPSADRGMTRSLLELSEIYADVCNRRSVPYVDTVLALHDHSQFNEDIARSSRDLPGQTGYGLIAWLVLHTGFGAWLGTENVRR
ncbi:lysophospholipase [Dermabacteraceae bacterium TAE3-ERU5]|nr:lysophospholipase [Dermabacteraceae bacterium TAE3-ERU5]